MPISIVTGLTINDFIRFFGSFILIFIIVCWIVHLFSSKKRKNFSTKDEPIKQKKKMTDEEALRYAVYCNASIEHDEEMAQYKEYFSNLREEEENDAKKTI